MIRISTALLLVSSSSSSLTMSSAALLGNVTSRLVVHIPQSLFKPGGYDHREALFGFPPYGGSITQNVYYAGSEFCDPSLAVNVDERWPSPFILMVDRGSCTFVQKVRNAQRAGAAAAIIADNVCQCSDERCQSSLDCESREPVMGDDGSGLDISIPSFLMFKADADEVKAELLAARPVQMEMAWSLPTPDDRVEYGLWTLPTDVVGRDFLRTFLAAVVTLGTRAYFTPHMYIYDGENSGCRGSDGTNQCHNLCTNSGRYCATDPDNDLDSGTSGSDVVAESLRRICIWKNYGEEDGIGREWWDYVNEFMNRCDGPDHFKDDACIRDAYKHAGVNAETVSQCIRDSGGLEDDKSNSLLESEIAAKDEHGMVIIPAVDVNGVVLRGSLTTRNVFVAICAGFAPNTAPEICQECMSCSDVRGCIDLRSCAVSVGASASASSQEGVSTHTFSMSMLFLIGMLSGLGVWYYKRSREDMRDQVRGILAEYMPLEGNDGDIGSPMDLARRQGGTKSLLS